MIERYPFAFGVIVGFTGITGILLIFLGWQFWAYLHSLNGIAVLTEQARNRNAG